MTALYDLAAEYAEIMLDVAAADGVLEDDLAARLDAIGGSLASKTDAVAAMVRSFEADAARFAEEEKLFQAKKKAAEERALNLKDYIRRCLELAGERKVKGALFTVGIQASAPAVLVHEGLRTEDFPERFRRTKTIVEVDKTALKAALQAGDEEAKKIAELRASTHVRIK